MPSKADGAEYLAYARRTVLNHIARFNVSSSTAATSGVRMYNGKRLHFEGNTFGGVEMSRSDILCGNGVLHLMKDVIPYSYNIREYIDVNSNTSMLSQFIKLFDEELFDVANSTPLDVNENGETIYDSVKIQYNRLLEYPYIGIGSVADEDSIFTMIVPTDNAWAQAYAEMKPWFVNADDSIQDVQASLAVFSNLVFRKEVTDPGQYTGLKDLLVSTTGAEHTLIPSLFDGATYIPASNGHIWLADQLNQQARESWNPDIEIESEASATRKTQTSTSYSGLQRTNNSSVRTYGVTPASEFAEQISEQNYIHVVSSSLDNAGVQFTLNGCLSGKYEIHAFFVPAVVDNPGAEEITKVSFAVTYPRAATGTRTQTTTFKDDSFVTSSDEMTEIVAGVVTFPVCNYIDPLRQMDESYDASSYQSNFTLYVQTEVTQAEYNAGTYKREFRLDRVVLVPVI
ncbi:MAG: hypothetical protein K2M98_00600 [Muribaculum sp.]|nr:hypothetical protein [Muribaculum sp.]